MIIIRRAGRGCTGVSIMRDSNEYPQHVFVEKYEGKSISNQPIPFSFDRDTQDIHALFQYMF